MHFFILAMGNAGNGIHIWDCMFKDDSESQIAKKEMQNVGQVPKPIRRFLRTSQLLQPPQNCQWK